MSSYASAEEVTPHLSAEALALLPDNLTMLLARCSRDLDLLLAPGLPDPVTGLKLDVEVLSAVHQAALVEAVAAQVEWRVLSDPEYLANVQDGVAGVTGLTLLTTPAQRPPSPAAVEALAGLGFPVRSGTALPDPDPDEIEPG